MSTLVFRGDYRRAAALQTEIEEAMTLATSSIGDYSWLHRLHSWVMEVAQGKAPDWWTDLDCEVSLPREEKRVSTFLSTQKKRITLQMCLS